MGSILRKYPTRFVGLRTSDGGRYSRNQLAKTIRKNPEHRAEVKRTKSKAEYRRIRTSGDKHI